MTENDVAPSALFHTELYVRMSCQSCVDAVTTTLSKIPGVDKIETDLSSELVRVVGTASALKMVGTLKDAGREARVIGLSAVELGGGGSDKPLEEVFKSARAVVPAHVGPYEENSNCVAEFKGKLYNHGTTTGVVRMLQLGTNSSIYEVALGGLTPGGLFSVAVHTSGDTSNGHDAIGPIFDSADESNKEEAGDTSPAGLLCTSTANEHGQLNCYGIKQRLRVWEIIGRSLAVDELPSTSSESDGTGSAPVRQAAAVIARSAGAGGNYKKVCSCDGTVIYDANGNL